jgi:integrase
VFTHWTGRSVDPDRLRDALRRDCALAGVDVLTVHQIRHTAATLLIEAGEPIDSVARRLGHNSVATTSGMYVHLSVEHDQAVGERLERFISGQ